MVALAAVAAVVAAAVLVTTGGRAQRAATAANATSHRRARGEGLDSRQRLGSRLDPKLIVSIGF